jgi:hypothetical protein
VRVLAKRKTLKVIPGGAVSTKDRLDYLVKVLGLTATYQDFPKKKNSECDGVEKTEVFTLLSISTDPAQVGVVQKKHSKQSSFLFASFQKGLQFHST